ncbi:MAG: hypothetical protein AAFP19_18940 [Bacteroidota bacterium]
MPSSLWPFADQVYQVKALKPIQQGQPYQVTKNKQRHFPQVLTDLYGPYQAKNIASILQTLDVLQSTFVGPIDREIIEKSLANVSRISRFIGRWHRLAKAPLTICDSAHNVGGIAAAMKGIAAIEHEQLHFVLGMVNDKDIHKILQLLPTEAKYYFAKANIPRGLDANALKDQAAALGLKGRAYASVVNALKAARRSAKENDLIYIGGSVFIVAEVI